MTLSTRTCSVTPRWSLLTIWHTDVPMKTCSSLLLLTSSECYWNLLEVLEKVSMIFMECLLAGTMKALAQSPLLNFYECWTGFTSNSLILIKIFSLKCLILIPWEELILEVCWIIALVILFQISLHQLRPLQLLFPRTVPAKSNLGPNQADWKILCQLKGAEDQEQRPWFQLKTFGLGMLACVLQTMEATQNRTLRLFSPHSIASIYLEFVLLQLLHEFHLRLIPKVLWVSLTLTNLTVL